jgi:hypothetical protein
VALHNVDAAVKYVCRDLSSRYRWRGYSQLVNETKRHFLRDIKIITVPFHEFRYYRHKKTIKDLPDAYISAYVIWQTTSHFYFSIAICIYRYVSCALNKN